MNVGLMFDRSRIRQNWDFFELDPSSGEFGYVDHPVFTSVQNTSRRYPLGLFERVYSISFEPKLLVRSDEVRSLGTSCEFTEF